MSESQVSGGYWCSAITSWHRQHMADLTGTRDCTIEFLGHVWPFRYILHGGGKGGGLSGGWRGFAIDTVGGGWRDERLCCRVLLVLPH